jgi:hypothetical protein
MALNKSDAKNLNEFPYTLNVYFIFLVTNITFVHIPSRVTRLGEFSPFGWLFASGIKNILDQCL